MHAHSNALTSLQKLQILHEANKKLNKKTLVFLDTDVGHDTDDIETVTSGILFNNPEIELIGAATADEFVDVKAQILKGAFLTMGKNVPVFVGKGLQLSDVKLENGKTPTSIEEACTLPIDKQKELIVKFYPTYPEKIFGGFYQNQGKAWPLAKPDGNINEAINLLKKFIRGENPNEPTVVIISIGPTSNIAEYFKAGLSKNLIVQMMGGWCPKMDGIKNETQYQRILGRNTIADIVASETVFSDKNSNLIFFTSNLRKDYNLQITGDSKKLLTLNDSFSIESLSFEKAKSLLAAIVTEANEIDIPDAVFQLPIMQLLLKAKPDKSQLNEVISKINFNDIKQIIKNLLSTVSMNSLPCADSLGRSLGRDCMNWYALSGFNYLILSDPGTAHTAIKPTLVTKELTVSLTVDAKLAIQNKEKFLDPSFFLSSVKTSVNGPISVIDELVSRAAVVNPIMDGNLAHMYRWVNYQEFQAISEAKDSLITKFNRLNQLSEKKSFLYQKIDPKFSLFSPQKSHETRANCGTKNHSGAIPLGSFAKGAHHPKTLEPTSKSPAHSRKF